ncbi:MAG: V-type ATP synthase subunit E family protein [archaeon]
MSLENLKKAMIEEAKNEAKKITSEAEKEAKQNLSEAEKNAKEIVQKAREKTAKSIEAERKERASAAQLKAKRIVSEARNRVVEDAMQQVWGEFSESAKGKGYEKLLKKLIVQGEKELGEKAIVAVNKSDFGAAKRISKNVSAKTAEISGGAIISSKSGEITIDNSLEAIFENSREDVGGMVYRELFGGKGK